MCEICGGQLAILFVIAEARRTASVATLLSVIVDSLITTHHGTGHYLMILRTDCLLLVRHVCRVLLVAFASAASMVFRVAAAGTCMSVIGFYLSCRCLLMKHLSVRDHEILRISTHGVRGDHDCATAQAINICAIT